MQHHSKLPALPDPSDRAGIVAQAEAAARLGMTEGAVKVAIHRLRRRFREALKREIGGTVSDTALVNGELHYLSLF